MGRFTDTLIEGIAGRALADRLHVSRLEKQHATRHTDEQNESSSSASSSRSNSLDEALLPQTLKAEAHKFAAQTGSSESSKGPKYFERTSSNYVRGNGTRCPARPSFQRAQSDIAPPQRPSFKSNTMSPDLTCAEFPQVERSNSSDGVYDPKVDPCPPLGEMKGMGRYRHSVHSTQQWEIEHIRKELGPMANYIEGDLEVAEAPGVMRHIRKDSEASAVSHQNSDYSEETDPDGRFIVRGFMPSGSSSAASSIKDVHHRTNSGLSMSSLRDDCSSPPSRPLSRKSSLCPAAGFQLGALTPITEAFPKMVPKKTVPLMFSSSDCAAEQAIHSDDNDSYEDAVHIQHAVRVPAPRANNTNPRVVQFATKPATEKVKAEVERSNTVKRIKPALRKMGSGVKNQGVGRPRATQKISAEEAKHKKKTEMKTKPSTVLEESREAQDEQNAQDADAASIASDDTSGTAVTITDYKGPAKVGGRRRSATAIKLPAATKAADGKRPQEDDFVESSSEEDKAHISAKGIAIPERRRGLRY